MPHTSIRSVAQLRRELRKGKHEYVIGFHGLFRVKSRDLGRPHPSQIAA